mgnify:CR=1 FL=1
MQKTGSNRADRALAIIDDNQIGTWYEGIPVVATYDTMFQYAKEQIVDEVFLNVPYDTGNPWQKWWKRSRIWERPCISQSSC